MNTDSAVIRHRITDLDDEEDYPDEYQLAGEEPVELDKGFSKIIIVDNLPIVPAEKYQKLLGVITKIYNQIPGGIVQIDMPLEDGFSKGFAFIEFTTPFAAADAVKQTNGWRLDRSHIFKVNFYEDFRLYDMVSETFQPEEIAPYKPKENLWWWLVETDGRARDQFVVRYGEFTEFYWNDGHKKKPESIHKQKAMTETYVAWSPYGTYLGTFHAQGVILWGGANWEKIVKFAHPGVKLLDFSPQENYLVTVSAQFQQNDDPKDPQCIIVWDVRSGRKTRGFLGSNEGQTWPVFKWSHDEKYFARLSKDTISVYETPSMELLEKKSIKVPGIRDFNWSPTDNIIACWVPGEGDVPAKVLLIDVPSRNIKRSHNMFKVQDCNLHWSTNGDYLSVKVDRLAGKKTTVTNFELFRVREKAIPVEPLQMTEPVVAFAWEPKGQRFAIIHGTGSKHDVSFYSMAGKKLNLLKKIEKRAADHLFWSPRGSCIVLAGFGALGGVLEFYNVEEMESMRSDTHHMATDLVWDPTGRFVATSTSYWRHQLDNGFTLWTFQGKMLSHIPKDKFYQFLWRPRPPSLLPAEKHKAIEKNLREYSVKYKRQDYERKRAAWEAFKKKRDDEKASFYNSKAERLEQRKKEKALRVKLRGGVDSEDESQYYEYEEEVEELLTESVEVVDL